VKSIVTTRTEASACSRRGAGRHHAVIIEF